MASPKADKLPPKSGTIIRAENGDILRYDETGMVMVLSDKVIADIDRRLPKVSETSEAQQSATEWVDADVLGDIDAWDVRQNGEWYLFTANLSGLQGVRQFRRLVTADDLGVEAGIIADASGPLRGILSLGGSRRATGYVGAPNYPWHVLAPADEIGAVGFAGTGAAKPCKMLQPLPEMTRDAVLADVLLSEQHQEHRGLNLYMTRTETDGATSIGALSDGLAYDNILAAAQTLQSTAKRLDKRAGLLAFNLEFSLEDVESDAKTYCTGMLDLIAKLTRDLSAMGFRRPPFLAVFDCGTHDLNDDPILRAQWELAWQGPDYGLCYTAPGYMFTQDRFGRPDMKAVWQMAEMEARALEVLYNEEIWMCPTFLLAEREPDPKIIRVRARAMQDLVIDTCNPFGAGEACGFSIEGAINKVKIINVAVASDDTQDILLTFDKEPKGKNLTLLYASDDGLKGLVFEQGINCGFEMTLPNGVGADYSFAIRFNAPTGNARTLLTLNPNKVDNYLFLQQSGGTINFKDQQNTLELMASIPSPEDATNLLVVGQSNGALNMRVEKENVIVTETRVDLGFNGPCKLFVGCRSNRAGLYKTLGSFVMKDIIFWPEQNVLQPKHSETLNMLDEYSMWED